MSAELTSLHRGTEMQNSKNTIKGIALGLTATVGWASFYIVSRYFFGTAGDELDPLWSSFLRYAVAALALLLATKPSQFKPALQKDWKLLLLLGTLGIAGESTLIFYAMKYTTAARGNLLTNISPIVTAIMSWLITRELFTRRQVAGMVLGTIGTLAIFFLRGGDDFAEGNTSFLLGDLLAVVAGICWSAYTVLGERVVKEHGPQVTTCLAFMFGAAAMLPACLISGAKMTFAISAKGWMLVLYLGLISSALGYLCWYKALEYLKPGVLGAFGYVSIILTFILSLICLGEKVSLAFALCLAMLLVGTGMMLKSTQPEK